MCASADRRVAANCSDGRQCETPAPAISCGTIADGSNNLNLLVEIGKRDTIAAALIRASTAIRSRRALMIQSSLLSQTD